MEVLGKSNPNELPPLNPVMALVSVLYFGTIYYVTAVVPPGYFYYPEHPYRLGAFFVLVSSVILLYILLTMYLGRRRKRIRNDKALSEKDRELMLDQMDVRNKKAQSFFLWVLVAYILLADFFIFRELIPDLIDSLFPYGIFFFAFCFIFTAILSRVFRRLQQDGGRMTGFTKVGFISLGGVGLLVLYYTTVVAFAYTIFPWIPSVKGGARVTGDEAISIVVDQQSLMRNPAFASVNGQLDNLVLLYSTSDSLYLGGCDWRNTQRSRGRRAPPILEVRRDEIKYLVKSAPTDCHSGTPGKSTP
jgi:hypothetical protein